MYPVSTLKKDRTPASTTLSTSTVTTTSTLETSCGWSKRMRRPYDVLGSSGYACTSARLTLPVALRGSGVRVNRQWLGTLK